MAKKRKVDRKSVQEAIVLLRGSSDFILVAAMKNPVHPAQTNGSAKTEPEENLRLFATEGFQPAKKIAATLGVIARGIYQKEELDRPAAPKREGLPVDMPPVEMKDNVHQLANRYGYRIVFGSDGDYGETLHLLHLEEKILPDGTFETTGKEPLMFQFPGSTDYAKSHFDELETWSYAQVPSLATVSGAPAEDLQDAIKMALIQIRKAWEAEDEA